MVPVRNILTSMTCLGLLASCSQAPSEAFAGKGFQDSRVVFVADSSDVEVKDVSLAFKDVPFLRKGETRSLVLRATTGRELSNWGLGCGSHFNSKAGSFDIRMGLSRQTDGWNVGNPVVMRNYHKITGTNYLVLLNKLSISRVEIERTGGGLQGKLGQGDAVLDISVIDVREGKRVWRSQVQARAERKDTLELLGRDAIRMAVDNFFTILPEAHRWGCSDMSDRFH